jgi:hypothetical protein
MRKVFGWMKEYLRIYGDKNLTDKEKVKKAKKIRSKAKINILK